MKPRLAFICFILVFICCEALAETPQEINRFSLVQYEDAGQKKWELTGRYAEIEQSKVNINEISALAFGKETVIKLKARSGDFDRENQLVHLKDNVIAKTVDGMILTTDSLYWNANTKDVFTDMPVNIKKIDFEVEGLGAVCDLDEKTAELKKDVVAKIKITGSPFLEEVTRKQRTTITCDGPLELNYKNNLATFNNNVRVEDGRTNITADCMDVFFNPDTKKAVRVAAKGNVKILSQDSVTYSDTAIYLIDEGRVVLPKRPRMVIQDGIPAE